MYSRWGEKVFSTKDISKGWDGTYKNKPCEMGTYFYLIEYEGYKNNTTEKEKKLLKGDVNLIRWILLTVSPPESDIQVTSTCKTVCLLDEYAQSNLNQLIYFDQSDLHDTANCFRKNLIAND